ncbi:MULTISPECIES: AraC family transcriptional regulator [unclassified Nocardia]|uniref:AraC family transcriptional regulator n=1 Tax=unclassified Nocardia TaxID=2637762 RepID=UPI002E12287C|nr:AraC family transcriptional regulator [Nocardia sp. NBC_01327]
MSGELGRLRSINNAALLVEFGAGRGLTMDSMLVHTGIKESDLTEPAAEIELEQEFELMANILAGTDDEPGLGLLAGMQCHPTSLGIWGFAISTSPNLRHALEIGLRYVDLSFTAALHRLDKRGADVAILRDDSMVPPGIRRFALERDLVAIGTVQQDLLPMRLPAVRLEVPLERHPMYETVFAMLGVSDMTFGAPKLVLTLQASSLELKLPQANPASMKIFEEQCAQIVQQRQQRGGISGQVRELLIHRQGMADQSDIAADLGLSVRTLRRRLADDGTTFRELSGETVGLLAEELLTAGLTVESVACRLGYASVSAFGSAFRAWKGQTPGQYARQSRTPRLRAVGDQSWRPPT